MPSTTKSASAAWLLLIFVHATTIRPSWQQAHCIASNGTGNILVPTKSASCVPSVDFFGIYVDLQHPLQCGGRLLAWNYCSAAVGNSSVYLTVWRARQSPTSPPGTLERVYVEELNASTVPPCPGAVQPSGRFVVEPGDYVGVIFPYSDVLPLSPPVVCRTCPECNRTLHFVQTISSNDSASQFSRTTLSEEMLMNDTLYMVDFAPVVVAIQSPTPPLQTTSGSTTTVAVVSSSRLVVAIVASIVSVSVLVVISLAVILCIIVNKRKLYCLEKKGETIGIGNSLYALSNMNEKKVCGGPIYEDPSVTMSRKPMPPELDYEVDPNLSNQTNWAQAYDVVTMARPETHEKAQNHFTEEDYEGDYHNNSPCQLKQLDEVPKSPPYGVPEANHHYHILERVVKGEYVHEDMRPFKEPPTHVNELYAELSKFIITRIPRDAITIVGPLGSGNFSFVNKGIWKDSVGANHDVAVKSLASSDHQSKVKFLQEAVIMGQFKHPNVVQLCGSVTEGDSILLVIEYLHNGDLAKHLQLMRTKSEDLVSPKLPTLLLEYCQQVAFGMHYLATKGFIHRDLAARNILVSQDGVCKIADFGLSRDLASEDYYVSKGGAIPIKWTAPEAIHYKKYSTASDVWSYGCLLYEIWSIGHKPFGDQSNVEVIQKISTGYRLPPPPGCPRSIYKLMVSCWHPETALRPQFRDILAVLIGYNGTVLGIPDNVIKTGPQAAILGASLESAFTLYSDLQTMYKVHLSS